jgi:hypothetical protein
LLRSLSECGLFVAVIDGDALMTEWVLAESTYAALLRKSVGKPRIILIVQNVQRIVEDKQNPINSIYLDVFKHSPAHFMGATILSVDCDRHLTEDHFLRAIEDVRPMSLLGL